MAEIPENIKDSQLNGATKRYSPAFFLRFFVVFSIVVETFFSEILFVDFVRDLFAAFLAVFLLQGLLKTGFSFQSGIRRLVNINCQILRLLSFALILSYLLNSLLKGFGPPGSTESFRYVTLYDAGLAAAAIAEILYSQAVIRWLSRITPTPGRKILLFYGFACLAGTYILILPISLKPTAAITLVDAFFTSVASITVTGMSAVNIAETFSLLGQFIILLLVQIGGLGIVLFVIGMSTLIRTRASIHETLAGQELYGIPHIGNVGHYLIKIFFLTLSIELIGAVLIYTFLPPESARPVFDSIFHAISAFCNAGVSTFSTGLELPPGAGGLKVVIAALVILGGIGFPVLLDIYEWIARKGKGRVFSFHSMLTIQVSIFFWILGFLSLTLTEWMYSAATGSLFDHIVNGAFYSVFARTAGFNISDIAGLSLASQLVLILLMTVGGGPLSTAGGVKTTTVGIVMVSVSSFLRGLKWIQYRTSEVPMALLQKAVSIIVLYFVFASVALIVLLVIEQMDPWALTFEVIAALSTAGFSLGVTPSLSPVGKLILLVLMLLGRLGILTVVYAGIGRVADQRFRYAKNEFFIG